MATEALLEFVVGNLLSFMQEELSTIMGVDSQIKKLSSNLTAISAVLQDAEENKITTHAVKNWLQKLSDAAYVLDDILDECSIQSSLLKSRNMCLTLSPKAILFRHDIGKRMKEIVKRFQDINEERSSFHLSPGESFERQREDDHVQRETCSVIVEPHMYGRDQDKEQIVEFLLRHASDGGELSVYPVVGMGGIGKTALATWVFNDGRIINQFELKIWVSVSNKFDVMTILGDIVESVEGQKPNNSNLESMQKKVRGVLFDKSYLLVLDDVWNEEEDKWGLLKGVLLKCLSATKGASILVTTRLEDVASIMGTHQTHRLSPLSEDDNWSVFKHHAFGPNGSEGAAELVAIGREIVRKCVGSPLASRALGSALRNVNEKKQWLNIKESKFWDIPKGGPVMGALKISYFNLNLSLRRCFSFCAIYPEDFQIVKEQLIHLWMANGFIKSKGKLEAEDVGNRVWGELHKRSFFQEVKIDLLGNTTFKIHDLFHELAQSIMGEECKASDSEGLNKLSSRVHHISCSGAEINLDMNAFKKLESLRTFVEHDCLFNCSYGLKAFNNSLRALCTSSSQLSGLESLTHLRYLNVYMLDITTLPECVTRLKRLQILKLETCENLSSLPKQLTQLKELRHLLIRWCNSLVEMPSNIGELKNLKTLNIFILNSKRQTSLAELRDLQLGGKLHIKGLENVQSESDARSANLMSKELSQLYLSWDCSSESKCTNSEKILEDLKPHCNLKSFGMKGYMGKNFPSWMMNTSVLSCLVSVILYDCKSCEQLPPLGKLPHLTNLFISGMEDVKHIDGDRYDGTEEKAFKSLKKLTLFRLPNLERMLTDATVDMLPLVSELRISCVPKLTSLPQLPSVELLSIEGWKSDSNNDMTPSLEAIMRSVPHVKSLSFSNLSGVNVSLDGLSSLNSLQVLQIHDCDELVSFKENVMEGLSSLRTLTIYQCKKLKSLPEGMGHLTCLENLTIYDCGELVTLPNNMNQLTALRHVLIRGTSTVPEGLQRIPSLQNLIIRHLEAVSLPEWLGDMTSIQLLVIINCPNIRSLPSSFQHLTNSFGLLIALCPKLEEWCKRRTGEEWRKTVYIPQSQDEIIELRKLVICEEYEVYWNINKPAGYSKFDELVDEIEGMFSSM